MITIRPYEDTDWSQVWPLLQDTFSTGDTYAYAPGSTEQEIHRAWVDVPVATYVACSDGNEVLGVYILKQNHAGLGGHVSNCGFVVSRKARRQGIATAMCEHAQEEAKARGFRAMQFNLVVSTNEQAVRLWKKMGFAIVGTLPGGYRHLKLGYVDAYIMYKQLVTD